MGDSHTDHQEGPTIPRPPLQILSPAEGSTKPATIHSITMAQTGDKHIRHPNSSHLLPQAALSQLANNQTTNITRMHSRPLTMNPVSHITNASGASTIMPVQREVIRHSTDISHAGKSVVISGNTTQNIQIHTTTSLPKQRQALFQITSTTPAAAGTISMPTMSSVIRGSAPLLQSQALPFSTHLPRGAVAAASALSNPKAGAANTAVLRPSQSLGAIQLTSTTHAQAPALHTNLNTPKTAVQASHSALQSSLAMNQSAQIANLLTIPKPGSIIPSSVVTRPSNVVHQSVTSASNLPSSVKVETNRAQLISTLKNNAPPRSNSPALTLANLSSQTELQRQHVAIHQPVSSSSSPSLQITLTPRSTSSEIKVNATTKVIHTTSSVAPPQPKVLLSTQAPGTSFVQQTSLAAIAKSVGMNLTTQSQATNLTALNMTVTPKGTTPTAVDIPVAKVPPQRHQHPGPVNPQIPSAITTSGPRHQLSAPIHGQFPTVVTTSYEPTRSESAAVYTQSSHPPLPSNLIVTQANHTPATVVMTTMVTSATQSSQDTRSSMPPYIAPQELYYHSVPYGSINHPLVYQHVVGAAQARLPGLPVAGQSSNLAANMTTQNIAVSSSGQPARFSHPLMVAVDPSRPINMHGGQYPQSGTSTPDSIRSASSSATDSATSVSSVTPVSSTVTAHAHAQNLTTSPQHGNNLTSTPISNPSASPRPSILRKRTADGPVIIKKPFNLSASEALSPHKETSSTPHSNLSSPKTPAGDNSQSSTDTALSAEANTPTPTHNNVTDMRIKQEPPDLLENGIASTPTHGNNIEASPRKKPRKQLLHANEDLKDNSSSDEELSKLTDFKQDRLKNIKREIRDEYVDEEGVRWTLERKRPSVTFLMNYYNITWKSKNNHYQKHTDIKLKDERRPTVNELSNQKGVLQKASGWKLYHLGAQLEDLIDLEKELCEKIVEVQGSIDPKPPPTKQAVGDDETEMVHELTQGNVQRCQLIADQLGDAKMSMLKVLDHKQRITEIVQKHMSKRPIKKKERT